MTINEKKSSATANVSKKSLTDGFTLFPRILRAPIANATSVGMVTAHAFTPVWSAINISAGNIMPESAHKPGRIISFGLLRPSRISRPIKMKKAKVKRFESTSQCYA
jgi:hypothetical protein